MAIKVIDLFAGPGGLGEGFASLAQSDGSQVFDVVLSIEKDEFAHRTLELRSFFHQFCAGEIPREYYDYLEGTITRDKLYALYPTQHEQAQTRSWLAELGSAHTSNDSIDELIRRILGKQEEWVLVGGPPCQAYSLVGRSRIKGASEEKYQADHRHFLYREYLRILAKHKPPIFILENVKGLLSASVNNQFVLAKILLDLQNPISAIGCPGQVPSLKYELVSLSSTGSTVASATDPKSFIVRAEEHGIPQNRHRLFIMGIRSDIAKRPAKLHKAKQTNIEEVIGDLPRLRSGLSKELDSSQLWCAALRQIAHEPWYKSEFVDKEMHLAATEALRSIRSDLSRGAEFMEGCFTPQKHAKWFHDENLNGVCNHSTRSHMRMDLYRYFFASIFASTEDRSPALEDFPLDLLPLHKNVEEAIEHTKFGDRFRVQMQNRPSSTIVSHISKDGHYFIHYDSTQCRSLTVREAARIQTFPDNYFFEGPRTEQYRQVGNAVPPLLAKEIAKVTANLLD